MPDQDEGGQQGGTQGGYPGGGQEGNQGGQGGQGGNPSNPGSPSMDEGEDDDREIAGEGEDASTGDFENDREDARDAGQQGGQN